MNEITEYHGLYEPPSKDFELNKIIFLDIDGVLVNRKILEGKMISYVYDVENDSYNHDFDHICLKHLETIIKETNAYIVISSTWRKRDLKWIRKIFKARNFKYWERIVGETCRGYHFQTREFSTLRFYRGNEIQAWLELFVERDEEQNYKDNVQYHYVIIDDDSDMVYWQRNNFVKTDHEIGLTQEDALDAIKILKGKKI